MAVQCPACSHVHFETNTVTVPTDCAGCGHDLSAPVVPLSAAPQRPASTGGASRSFLFAGLAVLSAAGWLLVTGMAERSKYLPATATVKAASGSREAQRQIRSSGEWIRYESANPTEASYVADGKRYAVSPGKRWQDKQQFDVWYLPESPQLATETRPFARLLVGVLLLTAGLFLFGLAFGVFGGVIEAAVESIKVPVPRTTDALSPVAAPPRWFAQPKRRRNGGTA